MNRPINQNSIFLQSEGDAWFKRNREHLDSANISESIDVQYICESLSPFKDKITNILEIGCSNGKKIESLCNYFSAKGSGIEPANEAVIEGNSRIKSSDITLVRGTSERLPFLPNSFDLVYFAFCLYLVDRSTLLQSVAEADRVLKPGGFLAITDFDPGSPRKRKYSHMNGLYSYKQDYAQNFTKTGQYFLLGKHSFSHGRPHFDEDPDERIATTLLFKEIDPFVTQT